VKVVLFCGGLGTRLRDHAGEIPKPMVKIGYRPILWHLMKYYAHYGHKEFILCLGYRADAIKDFFLNYNECISNDFTIKNGGKEVQLMQNDISDWSVTCLDTGLNANIGQRLKAAQQYIEGEDYFLANYADALSDLHLPSMIDTFKASGKIGSFVCVKPSQSFSLVSLGEGDSVERIDYVKNCDFYINGGFFCFKKEIFNYMHDGEELVVEPFKRLIEQKSLLGYKYDKFWHCMDTFKEQKELNDMFEKGNAPWEVWKR
jgi:glucose-1-phosphate cytidylyltransferase